MTRQPLPREPVVLRRDGIVLTAPEPRDIDRIVDACRSAGAYENLTTPWPYRRADADYFVGPYCVGSWTTGDAQVFAIREADDGPVLGTLELRFRGRATPEVGYHLFPDARGRGLMTRAVGLLVDWAFEHDVERVEWEAIAGNHASAAVVRRLGFQFDGAATTTVTSGRHAGRLAWFAHRDRGDAPGEASGWPAPGELLEADPLPPPGPQST